MRSAFALPPLLCLLFFAGSALAQGGRVTVQGRVLDESGAPIAGATVHVSSETHHYADLTTDADGRFTATVRPTPALRLAAEHPSYGEQWTDMRWSGWSRYDAIPPDPVELVLRRGVVLAGRLLDVDGSPRGHETLLLIPAYVGSGPRPLTVRTGADGSFSFPRAVLTDFEIVPRSLDHWHPETGHRPGDFVRVATDTSAWLAHARAGEPVELRLQAHTLVTVTFAVTHADGARAARQSVYLWLRTSPTTWLGTQRRTDAQGRCTALVEPRVPYEVWVSADTSPHTPPWSDGVTPGWRGTVEAATTVPIVVP